MMSVPNIYERLRLPVTRQFILIFLMVAALMLMLNTECLADNEATSFLDTFKAQTDSWWDTLRGYAWQIFMYALMLEVVLFGARMALQQTQVGEIIQQFVWVLLFAGFIAAVIWNYEDWANKVAITGLKSVAENITPVHADAGSPMALASKTWECISGVANNLGGGIKASITFLVLEIVGLIICILLALISALVIIITCEFYIVANVGILLIGLGGSKIFKDYAINTMRYVLSVGIKLFVLQLIINIGLTIISPDYITATVGTSSDIDFGKLFMLIAQALILLCVAKVLPETVSGIISGSHISGGNPLAATSRGIAVMGGAAIGTAAGHAAGAVGGTAGAVRNLGRAAELARASGATGFFGTLQGMGQQLRSASAESKMMKAQQNPTVTNIMKSRIAQARAMKNDG